MDALLDILSLADENGQFYSTTRKLMERWGWGSGKTVSFIKKLEEQNIIGTQTEHKRNTLIRINTGLVGIARNTNGTQTEHKRNAKADINIGTKEALKRIIDAWNELSVYGISPIVETEISSMQYQNIIDLTKMHGVENILQAIQKIQNSDFLQGKSKCGWKITFDWFVLPGNFIKVIAGNYDNRNGGVGNAPTRAIKTYDDRIGKNGT